MGELRVAGRDSRGSHKDTKNNGGAERVVRCEAQHSTGESRKACSRSGRHDRKRRKRRPWHPAEEDGRGERGESRGGMTDGGQNEAGAWQEGRRLAVDAGGVCGGGF